MLAAKVVRRQAGLMLDAMVRDFERATDLWHAERMVNPGSFVLTAGALDQAKFALGGLIVDADRMRENLGISRGLIVPEAVMMALAPKIGRSQEHDLVSAACRCGNAARPGVTAHLDRDAIARLTDPANSLGAAPEMVDRVLAGSPRGARRRRKVHPTTC